MKKQIIIDGQETSYYITDDGRLYNEKTNNWYKGQNKDGYISYDLRVGNIRKIYFAHRLVAEYFIPNPDNLPVVNHIDGNKTNNKIENLEWTTYRKNILHAYNTGLKEKTNGMDSRITYSGDLEGEKWKQYKNTNYYVSNKGRIRNIKTNNILKGKITSRGYIEWCLSSEGKKKSVLAHRIVFETFVEELKEGYVINHIDGNRTNNDISNLEQVLPSENSIHSFYQLGHKNVRTVGKYDKEGHLLDTYPSCAEAARQNPGCYSNNISNVCNGKMRTHKGFIWKYLSD